MSKNVTIVGGGIAGVTAALAANIEGAQVTLITGRPGATALASGAWDLGRSQRSRLMENWKETPSPRTIIRQMIREAPDHPYAWLDQATGMKDLTEQLDEALKVLCKEMPYSPVGSLDEPLALVTPAGSVKWTALADPSQAAGNLLKVCEGRLLVAGIPGLATFPIFLLQQILQKVLPEKTFTSIAADWVEIEGIPQHSLSPFALAERLEEERCFEYLVCALRDLVKRHQASHLLLPPVIGVSRGPHLMERLQKEIGVICFESLSTVPSVPGLRRYRALEEVLSKKQIRVLAGRVSAFKGSGDRVTRLTVKQEDQETDLEVDRVILSTGRFLSGGIERKGEMRESLFGLPIFSNGELVGNRFVGKMVEQNYLRDHILFSVGVKTDSNLRPLNRWGGPVYSNVHAAGSLLGGYSAAAGGSGSGVAILSGWIAGKKAVS